MKHFMIEVTYTVPIERIDEVTAEHRAFLQKWYDEGTLLMSGPQVPRTGGIILGKCESREKMEEIFSQDPFKLKGCAMYRIVEFNPVKHQEFLKTWL
ncbi:MAG TPA: YciI family protein [Leptospiraceae bacterium]|jgi:uncharacterized protein YciI|nr:YciI family protein [Leptospirales bacterium]HMW59395.1 YciI family protein [Leptospiraceae bacterium]HMX55224.1 YciI family protein [Leptospiraceae bacterium]HMZ36351.1 YciI family protein [Leptospiraceae bacterium]HNJ02666.1 YciI family protein [Leptospiraceae bacterium]